MWNRFILFIFSCLFNTFIFTSGVFFKRENSFVSPFSGSNWDFSGSTLITSNKAFLTKALPSQEGRLWNVLPLTATNWEVHIQFKVHSEDSSLFGDGWAFWYIEKYLEPGTVFGNSLEFKGLAVFLDTYNNHNGAHHHVHPYISAMINNGSLKYDHDSDGTHTQLAGCSLNFRNIDVGTHLLVRYRNNVLQVQTIIDNSDTWTTCFSVENVKLPTGYFLGVSAATGDLFDNHEILSIKTYEIDGDHKNEDRSQIEPSAQFESERVHSPDDEPSLISSFNWFALKMFLIVIFSIVVLAVGLGLGMYYYMKKQESKRRFY